MDSIDSMEESVDFYSDDRDNEIFSRSLTTPIAHNESLEEKERLRIISEIFGSPGLAAFGIGDLNQDKSGCDSQSHQSQQSKTQDEQAGSYERKEFSKSGSDGSKLPSGMPMLARRKSNPFYNPSRQIVDLVSKRRKSKAPGLLKSQSSSAILTMSQVHDKRGARNLSDAGSLRRDRS